MLKFFVGLFLSIAAYTLLNGHFIGDQTDSMPSEMQNTPSDSTSIDSNQEESHSLNQNHSTNSPMIATDAPGSTNQINKASPEVQALKTRIVKNYTDIAFKTYEDSLNDANLLRDKVPVSYTHLTLPTIYSV